MGTMKIIITGGMGFIFSHVTEHFLEKGYEVHVFDNLSAGSHPELLKEWVEKYPNFHFLNIDVAFHSTVNFIREINPEYIIHAAAISDVDHSINHPSFTITQNNDATLNVFDAARQCDNLRRLLYVSTDEVYGECDHPKTEDEIIFPKNPYACSKAFGSILRLAYDNSFAELRDKTVETRFCNVFGPRQDDRKIIPAIKRAMFSGTPLKLHNNGEGYRQFIYVKEIPPLIDLLLERGHRVYNITSGRGYTISELCDLAYKLTGRVIPVVAGNRSGMDMRYEMSGWRLFDEFRWKPQDDFEDKFKEYLNADSH